MQSYWGNEKRSSSAFLVQQAQTTTSGVRQASWQRCLREPMLQALIELEVKAQQSTSAAVVSFSLPVECCWLRRQKAKPIATAKIGEEIADAAKLEYPAYVSGNHLTGRPI